jgi:hydroxylamine reductase
VSGHDLKDLEMILKQTEGKGINVYTHGEMLPCHGYPELKKYAHFYGHYGTAWQNQAKEFAAFPGRHSDDHQLHPEAARSYKDNIFTTGLVGWPGVTHIADKDFTPVIDKALAMPGFRPMTRRAKRHGRLWPQRRAGRGRTGHRGRQKQGHPAFFLVGGCDGAKPGRDYYTELVEKIPAGLRRADPGLRQVPLSSTRTWATSAAFPACWMWASATMPTRPFRSPWPWPGLRLRCQRPAAVHDSFLVRAKACVILLSLLHLGIKDIRLGPSLPAFMSPNVLDVLVKNFNIMPIGTPDEDLKAILGKCGAKC